MQNIDVVAEIIGVNRLGRRVYDSGLDLLAGIVRVLLFDERADSRDERSGKAGARGSDVAVRTVGETKRVEILRAHVDEVAVLRAAANSRARPA